MVSVIELLFRVLNGLITLYIFYLLYGLFNKTQRRFYQYWSSGFLFYGANILLRIFIPEIKMDAIGLLALLLNIAGFILMMTGIGELVNRGRVTLAVSLVVQFILMFFVIKLDSEKLGWVIVLSPHVIIILSLGFMYLRYKVKIGAIILGWSALFVANYALSASLLSIMYVDIISALAKVVVFIGMSHPTFSFLVDDLRAFMLGGMPSEFPEDHAGGFYLINLGNVTKTDEVKWIKNRVSQNDKKGIRTILFNFYDLLDPTLFSEETQRNLYMVRIIIGKRDFADLFENQVITINDDPSLIQIVLKDIINASMETTVPTEILVYSLSSAILSHGWYRIYSMIISNNSRLKESHVSITCFFYPDTHSDSSILVKFQSMAEKTIEN